MSKVSSCRERQLLYRQECVQLYNASDLFWLPRFLCQRLTVDFAIRPLYCTLTSGYLVIYIIHFPKNRCNRFSVVWRFSPKTGERINLKLYSSDDSKGPTSVTISGQDDIFPLFAWLFSPKCMYAVVFF